MKGLFIVSILLCSLQSLWASDLIFNFEKFKRLPYQEKVEVVKTYQRLSAKVDENSKKYMKLKLTLNQRQQFVEDFETYAKLTKQFFLAEAIAQSFDLDKKCAFAGWVADYDKKGLCNLYAVKKANSNYLTSACGSQDIPCNPMLFGKNDKGKAFCVDAYLPGNRGASHDCMVKSSAVVDQAKHMKDIIDNIIGDPHSFHQLALVIQRLCLCESAEAKNLNAYRNRLNTDVSSSTCAGLIKQLKTLLNKPSATQENLKWFWNECSVFNGNLDQKTFQKDLSGIKAIVDKLEDETKYNETLKAVCGPEVVVGSGPGVALDIVTASPVSIDVTCTEGDCPGLDVKPTTSTAEAINITSGGSVGLVLETGQEENGTMIDIKIEKIECKSMKTVKAYTDGTDGCKLSWEASGLASGASVTLDGPTNNSVERATSEFSITITLTDGKEKVVSTETIAAKAKESISTGTSEEAISITEAAIDLGSDDVPGSPGMPPFLDLGPPFMFIIPGQP